MSYLKRTFASIRSDRICGLFLIVGIAVILLSVLLRLLEPRHCKMIIWLTCAGIIYFIFGSLRLFVGKDSHSTEGRQITRWIAFNIFVYGATVNFVDEIAKRFELSKFPLSALQVLLFLCAASNAALICKVGQKENKS